MSYVARARSPTITHTLHETTVFMLGTDPQSNTISGERSHKWPQQSVARLDGDAEDGKLGWRLWVTAFIGLQQSKQGQKTNEKNSTSDCICEKTQRTALCFRIKGEALKLINALICHSRQTLNGHRGSCTSPFFFLSGTLQNDVVAFSLLPDTNW